MSTRGFSLIELLVAMVILSVGLLGGSFLLLGGLRDHGLALRQQAATLLVADMADRVRASMRVSDADLARFQAAALEHFPFQSPEALVSLAPATGPAIPAVFHIVLRWRESGDDATTSEASLLVYAQSPVAG